MANRTHRGNRPTKKNGTNRMNRPKSKKWGV